MLTRVAAQSARTVISRRAPTAIVFRSYSESVGRGTQPDGIAKKEKAQEDFFIHQREHERAKKLEEKIAKDQAELDELNKKKSEKK